MMADAAYLTVQNQKVVEIQAAASKQKKQKDRKKSQNSTNHHFDYAIHKTWVWWYNIYEAQILFGIFATFLEERSLDLATSTSCGLRGTGGVCRSMPGRFISTYTVWVAKFNPKGTYSVHSWDVHRDAPVDTSLCQVHT